MEGFKAIDIKFNENNKASHNFYIKPHNVREKVQEKPKDRTLFVVGIPSYCNEETLRELFNKFGNVKNVFIHKTPSPQIPPTEEYQYFQKEDKIRGYKIAYIVFEKEISIKKAMNYNEVLIYPNYPLTGVQKWMHEYNKRFPDKKKMEEEIKTFMDKFDEETNKKIQMEKDLTQPQEDGWVTVTKRGKKPGFARKESVINQLREKEERQRQKRELTNFYTFQIKESKMKNLFALRKKFEDDKRKMAALKEARRFKPF